VRKSDPFIEPVGHDTGCLPQHIGQRHQILIGDLLATDHSYGLRRFAQRQGHARGGTTVARVM